MVVLSDVDRRLFRRDDAMTDKTYSKAELDAAVASARLESFQAGLDQGAAQKSAMNDFDRGKAIAASQPESLRAKERVI